MQTTKEKHMIIVDRPDFKLRLTVKPDGDRHSLELHQLHPKAQRPHWRRITQLNLTEAELDALIASLQAHRVAAAFGLDAQQLEA